MIDRHIWDHVQNELARRKETAMQKSKYSGRYPYSGKLVCGECGRSFVSRTKKLHSGDIYKAWRCCENALHGKLKTDTDGNRIGCSSSSVNDKTLTEAAAYCLKLVYNNFTEIKQAMLKEIEHVSRLEPSANTERLEKELEKLQRKKERVIELTLDGTLTKEELTEQKTVLNRKIYELSEKITALKSIFEAQRIKTADAEAYAGEIERIMLMKTENTALYGSLLSKIIVCRDKKLIVYFKGIPFGIKLVCTTYGRGGTYRAEFEVLCFVQEKK